MISSWFKPINWLSRRSSLEDGLQWDIGLKPHASGEFSLAVAQANAEFEDQGQVLTTPYGTLIGVYDGHGGAEAARFLTIRMFSAMDRFIKEVGGMSLEVMKKAFHATDEDFLQFVESHWRPTQKLVSVGSCCLVGVIVQDMLYLGNLGDSRAVLGRYSIPGETDVIAEQLTYDHSSREILKRLEVNIGITQLTRSMGDYYVKRPEFSKTPLFRERWPLATHFEEPALNSVPSVCSRKLRHHDLFVILASDGLWDQLSNAEAVRIVSKYSRVGIAKRLVRTAVEVALRKIGATYDDLKDAPKGLRRRIHDDITVIVIYFDHQVRSDLEYNYSSAPADMSVNSPCEYHFSPFPELSPLHD